MSEERVSRLRQLDTCAVSDAMDQLGYRGVALGIRPQWACGKIAGRTVTYKLVPAGMAENMKHLGTGAVEAAAPGDIIVVDHRGRTDAAGWGGILSLAAKTKGIGGVIVDGACRDVDESAELGFPVYARAAVPLTARGRVVEEACNVPVDIAGIVVRPGDFVLADGSGVVFIPAAHADQVLDKAEYIAGKEREMARQVSAGRPVSEVMGVDYETMLRKRDKGS